MWPKGSGGMLAIVSEMGEDLIQIMVKMMSIVSLGVSDQEQGPQSFSFSSFLYSKMTQDRFNVQVILKVRWSLRPHVHSQTID